MDKYEIYKEFRAGMLNAITVTQVPENQSKHWTAGWRAGKDAMHEMLNAYLESIGVEKMGMVRAAQVTDAMVTRFLTWPLPSSVCADHCATVQNAPHRTGTNLLSAAEAKQMLEHVLNIRDTVTTPEQRA